MSRHPARVSDCIGRLAPPRPPRLDPRVKNLPVSRGRGPSGSRRLGCDTERAHRAHGGRATAREPDAMGRANFPGAHPRGIMTEMDAPVAKRVPHVRRVHGDETVDEWYWLVDRDDPDTRAYLEAENAFTEAGTAHLGAVARAAVRGDQGACAADRPVGARAARPVVVRDSHRRRQAVPEAVPPSQIRTTKTHEQVLLDGNELAGDSPYFSFGVVDVSPDHRLVAYSTDYDGNESLHRPLQRSRARANCCPTSIEGTYYGSAWATDNATFFYTTIDEAHRPYRVWRHRLGTASADDVIVYEETDERFFVSIGLSRSQRYIVVSSNSKITSEVRVLAVGRARRHVHGRRATPTGRRVLARPPRRPVRDPAQRRRARLRVGRSARRDAGTRALATASSRTRRERG